MVQNSYRGACTLAKRLQELNVLLRDLLCAQRSALPDRFLKSRQLPLAVKRTWNSFPPDRGRALAVLYRPFSVNLYSLQELLSSLRSPLIECTLMDACSRGVR